MTQGSHDKTTKGQNVDKEENNCGGGEGGVTEGREEKRQTDGTKIGGKKKREMVSSFEVIGRDIIRTLEKVMNHHSVFFFSF